VCVLVLDKFIYFLIHKNLISSFNLRLDALCCVNFEAGEVFGI